VRRRDGFTLIELLVATAVLAVVMVYLTQTFTVQQRTYQVVDQVTEAQQNLRAIGALLERDVRMAGFMVPDGGAVCAVDSTNAPDVLYVSDAGAIDPTGFLFPELGADVLEATYGGSTGNDDLTVANAVLDGNAFYDTNGDGANDNDFRPGSGAILIDFANPLRGRACGLVQAANLSATSVRVSFSNALVAFNAAIHSTPDLRLVPAHVYSIGGASGLDLQRNGQILATDVEDMQVAFFYDKDDDGVVDAADDEYAGASGEPAYAPGSANWDPAVLREVRVNFVTRSHSEDPNTRFTQGAFQATENRAAVAGTDRFRRRVHTATIRVRNVGTRDLPV
jgi:prepilin-type N-terminal cleavage/methylation domain-containing protein